jgi:hypothetical protein
MILTNQPDDLLDALAVEVFRHSNIPAQNSAFQRELSLYLTMHRLDPGTKFMELPPSVQSLIAQRAAVSLELPSN